MFAIKLLVAAQLKPSRTHPSKYVIERQDLTQLLPSVFLPVWFIQSVCFGEEEIFAEFLVSGKNRHPSSILRVTLERVQVYNMPNSCISLRTRVVLIKKKSAVYKRQNVMWLWSLTQRTIHMTPKGQFKWCLSVIHMFAEFESAVSRKKEEAKIGLNFEPLEILWPQQRVQHEHTFSRANQSRSSENKVSFRDFILIVSRFEWSLWSGTSASAHHKCLMTREKQLLCVNQIQNSIFSHIREQRKKETTCTFKMLDFIHSINYHINKTAASVIRDLLR